MTSPLLYALTPPTTCTITVHEAAPAREGLTVELASDFSGAFVEALKRDLEWRDRAWDEARRRWYVAPHCLGLVQELALGRDDRATLVTDGGRTVTDLRSGARTEQLALF